MNIPQSWTPRLFDWFPHKLSFTKYAGRTEVQKWPLKKRRWIIYRVLENDADCHFLNTCIGTTHVPSFIFTKYFHGLIISLIFAFSFPVRRARKCGPYFPSHRTEAWKELRTCEGHLSDLETQFAGRSPYCILVLMTSMYFSFQHFDCSNCVCPLSGDNLLDLLSGNIFISSLPQNTSSLPSYSIVGLRRKRIFLIENSVALRGKEHQSYEQCWSDSVCQTLGQGLGYRIVFTSKSSQRWVLFTFHFTGKTNEA